MVIYHKLRLASNKYIIVQEYILDTLQYVSLDEPPSI